jgi:hypothetical protein
MESYQLHEKSLQLSIIFEKNLKKEAEINLICINNIIKNLENNLAEIKRKQIISK